MKIIGYEKRKNKELFKSFKNLKTLDIKEIQNYIPIYNKFFNFDKTQEINLDNYNFITNIEDNDNEDSEDEFPEKIFNVELNSTMKKKSFLKLIPVIEASQFLTGKYKLTDDEFYKLPNIENDGHNDFYDMNNISYIDSFFSFLSSKLLNTYHFENAIDYYGSFLSIIDNFKLDISDDIEYYAGSDFFMKNKNKLFRIEDENSPPPLIFEDTDQTIAYFDK